jgi:serine/threonine protein kinase
MTYHFPLAIHSRQSAPSLVAFITQRQSCNCRGGLQLLHNELIPELPFALKVKMAYQAAKGMHFLHSSGIVHRDLKSLNLLLDNKWNVKVSDFGLTQFKEDAKNNHGAAHQMSIHWTAPEVLNEAKDIDYALADVYSFGTVCAKVCAIVSAN